MSPAKKILPLRPTKSDFFSIAAEYIKQDVLVAGQSLRLDEDGFSIYVLDSDGNVEFNFSLQNAYKEYGDATFSKRNDILKTYFRNLTEAGPPEKLEDAMAGLLPRVQERWLLEYSNVRSKMHKSGIAKVSSDDEMAIPYIPFVEHFAECVVYDSPRLVCLLTEGKLAEWQSTPAQLRQTAISNLDKLTPKPFAELEPGAGIYFSQYKDTHDASRILLLDRVRECRVEGRHLVSFPNRETLFITGEDNLEGIFAMLRLIEDCQNEPRPMSGIPLVLSGNEWQIWQPDEEHPYRLDVENVRLSALAEFYRDQKEIMERALEAEGTNLFPLDFMVMQYSSGDMFTAAVWIDKLRSLLPVVDMIFFRQIGQSPDVQEIMIPWAVARNIIGKRMKPMGCYPERYLIDSYPTSEELELMNSSL